MIYLYIISGLVITIVCAFRALRKSSFTGHYEQDASKVVDPRLYKFLETIAAIVSVKKSSHFMQSMKWGVIICAVYIFTWLY